MRFTPLLVVLLALSGCGAAAQPPSATIAFPLAIEGRRFLDADGAPFPWRGITAFRLAEMTAHGREHEAAAYLDWAASQRLTVVRVLLMAQHLFKLPPEDGRAALPRLLDLARARGIAVEIVSLADSLEVPNLDYDRHIEQVGRIALEKGNALIEIANEPGHHTQAPRVRQPAFLMRLAESIPEPLLVALGSLEYSEGFAGGDYATTHVPRGERAWDHVLAIANRAGMVGKLQKPLVSDEPIGAAAAHDPGRRDNEPARFAAAAALTRFVGMEATFHYEGGLHARIPNATEAACLQAWRSGLELVADVPLDGQFLDADKGSGIARVEGPRATFTRLSGGQAAVLMIDPPAAPVVQWAHGWTERSRRRVPGAELILAERRVP